MCLASVPARLQRHTRERGAPRNGLSSGEALAFAVEVASVRHRATVSSSGASRCVWRPHCRGVMCLAHIYTVIDPRSRIDGLDSNLLSLLLYISPYTLSPGGTLYLSDRGKYYSEY